VADVVLLGVRDLGETLDELFRAGDAGLNPRIEIQSGATMAALARTSEDFGVVQGRVLDVQHQADATGCAKLPCASIVALLDTIADVLPGFTADECANYFAAAGYQPE
jgi:hypothetical protein